MKYLTINRCPVHDFYAVMLEDGTGVERRLTPSKCCGRWEAVKRWPINDKALQEIANGDGDKLRRE